MGVRGVGRSMAPASAAALCWGSIMGAAQCVLQPVSCPRTHALAGRAHALHAVAAVTIKLQHIAFALLPALQSCCSCSLLWLPCPASRSPWKPMPSASLAGSGAARTRVSGVVCSGSGRGLRSACGMHPAGICSCTCLQLRGHCRCCFACCCACRLPQRQAVRVGLLLGISPSSASHLLVASVLAAAAAATPSC